MYVNTEQVQMGVTNYIEHEIGNKAVGVNKFFVYFSLPIFQKKIADYMREMSQGAMKELFDATGNVDLDKVYSMAKSAIQKSGQFVWLGIVFNEGDVDKLYAYIKGGNL